MSKGPKARRRGEAHADTGDKTRSDSWKLECWKRKQRRSGQKDLVATLDALLPNGARCKPERSGGGLASGLPGRSVLNVLADCVKLIKTAHMHAAAVAARHAKDGHRDADAQHGPKDTYQEMLGATELANRVGCLGRSLATSSTNGAVGQTSWCACEERSCACVHDSDYYHTVADDATVVHDAWSPRSVASTIECGRESPGAEPTQRSSFPQHHPAPRCVHAETGTAATLQERERWQTFHAQQALVALDENVEARGSGVAGLAFCANSGPPSLT